MTCNDIADVLPLYLSGELDAQKAGDFAQHLQACRLCAAKVEQTKKLDQALRESVLADPVDGTAVDGRIRGSLAAARASSLRLRWFAAVAALFLAGILSYRTTFANRAPQLCVDAAKDHESEITLVHPRKWLTDAPAIAGLAERIGVPSSLIATLTPHNYSLKQAKLCRLDGQIFLHLVYAQGERQVSVYLRPAQDSASSWGSVRDAVAGRDHVAYFEASQVSVMFVSDQPGDVTLSLARSAAQVLAS